MKIFSFLKKLQRLDQPKLVFFFTFDLGSFNWIYKEIRQEVVNNDMVLQGTTKWPWKAFALVLANCQI